MSVSSRPRRSLNNDATMSNGSDDRCRGTRLRMSPVARIRRMVVVSARSGASAMCVSTTPPASPVAMTTTRMTNARARKRESASCRVPLLLPTCTSVPSDSRTPDTSRGGWPVPSDNCTHSSAWMVGSSNVAISSEAQSAGSVRYSTASRPLAILRKKGSYRPVSRSPATVRSMATMPPRAYVEAYRTTRSRTASRSRWWRDAANSAYVTAMMAAELTTNNPKYHAASRRLSA